MPYEDAENTNAPRNADEALLAEIRERYRYAVEAWGEIREESQKDRRYLAGDPWEDEDRKARRDAGRPCINHDELTQYVNQSVNTVRQNKRGIAVEPAGNGANDQSAELKENLIRSLEYRSKAQHAYVTAYEHMVQGSYGFFRLGRKYVSNNRNRRDASLFDQEITVRAVPNQDSVLYDPDCKEPDGSDARFCFVIEPMPKEEFRRRFKHAQIKDFTTEHQIQAKDWIQDKTVLVAEYWTVEVETSTLYLLASGEVVDELPEGEEPEAQRTLEIKTVKQYITNGVEILEDKTEPGEEIPIISMLGRQMYLDDGGGAKRVIFSLPRLARDPQMSLAYLRSQQMEEAGLSPKTPYIGYVGQFETDAEAWESATKQPHPYLQVDPITDQSNGQILPHPQRVPFTPNFQAYEIAVDSCRRAIQAAMGISPLPTAAMRANEKSGIALERIQNEQAIGSFHFQDTFEWALQRAGRIIDSWIPVVYDTEREIGLRKPDDSHHMVRINTPMPYLDPKSGQMAHYPIGEGDHDITVNTAPSSDSQRQAASEFLDGLIQNLQGLPVAPPQAAKLLSLAIQMKQLGPKGDQMAEIIAPDQGGQQQAQALAQAQQQAQQMQLAMAEMKAELDKLQQEKAGKVIDNEYRLQLEKLKIEAQLAQAEITTKAQQIGERIKFIEDVWQQLHQQQHDQAMQATDQMHERQMAGQQQQAALEQQAQQQQAQPQQPPMAA